MPDLKSQETAPIGTISTAVRSTASAAPATARKFRRGLWAELWRWAVIVVLTTILAGVLLVGSLVVAIYMQARSDESGQVDAIVVLGSAQYNGRPSPVLKARLDRALQAYEDGLAPYIVVTGGKAEGDVYTEAEAGFNYLLDQGVPDTAVLFETHGQNTWESMQGVAVVLEREGLTRVLLVSDGFHLFRAKLMANELGLSSTAVASSESPIRKNSFDEFFYVLREAAATIFFVVRDRP
jgi:uncharacterized SAM-binding protein YcdF (DUF218 family)